MSHSSYAFPRVRETHKTVRELYLADAIAHWTRFKFLMWSDIWQGHNNKGGAS